MLSTCHTPLQAKLPHILLYIQKKNFTTVRPKAKIFEKYHSLIFCQSKMQRSNTTQWTYPKFKAYRRALLEIGFDLTIIIKQKMCNLKKSAQLVLQALFMQVEATQAKTGQQLPAVRNTVDEEKTCTMRCEINHNEWKLHLRFAHVARLMALGWFLLSPKAGSS